MWVHVGPHVSKLLTMYLDGASYACNLCMLNEDHVNQMSLRCSKKSAVEAQGLTTYKPGWDTWQTVCLVPVRRECVQPLPTARALPGKVLFEIELPCSPVFFGGGGWVVINTTNRPCHSILSLVPIQRASQCNISRLSCPESLRWGIQAAGNIVPTSDIVCTL